jgi:hypothetical protein
MGNQMFQYAAARRLALRHQTEVVLDCGWFSQSAQRVATPRTFALGPFELAAGVTCLPHEVIARWEYRTLHRVRGRLSRHGLRQHVEVVRGRDMDSRFDARVLHAPRNTLLVGYWQSEGYFADAERQIRLDFAFGRPPRGESARLLGEIDGANTVAVHVRRGDYATEPGTAAVHGTLPAEYYRSAWEHVAERADVARAFVFSDDPPWCRRELTFPVPTVVVDDQIDAASALMLMSRCSHQVISHSTFGWWGAWLNPSLEKIVVAPSRWFRDAGRDSSDIVPAGWLRL